MSQALCLSLETQVHYVWEGIKMKHEKSRPRSLSATSLVGDGVVNAHGEDLGKIEDLMIDLNAGKVAYCVLSFGGFMGMGNKLFAIPWEAVTVDTDRKVFVLNVDKEVLKNAPGFDKDNWPDFEDVDWLTGIYDYYGYRPYWD
jgi:sporulation protein YlmC with PRC-barrel domain